MSSSLHLLEKRSLITRLLHEVSVWIWNGGKVLSILFKDIPKEMSKEVFIYLYNIFLQLSEIYVKVSLSRNDDGVVGATRESGRGHLFFSWSQFIQICKEIFLLVGWGLGDGA